MQEVPSDAPVLGARPPTGQYRLTIVWTGDDLGPEAVAWLIGHELGVHGNIAYVEKMERIERDRQGRQRKIPIEYVHRIYPDEHGAEQSEHAGTRPASYLVDGLHPHTFRNDGSGPNQNACTWRALWAAGEIVCGYAANAQIHRHMSRRGKNGEPAPYAPGHPKRQEG